ncbi:MAG: hypothetical protein MR747_06655 [Bacteroidales bacterium]|nr:hypothetical protein [Bacteroidales bacterium]
MKCFLEAFKPRDLAEGKTFGNRKFVIGDKIFEEISRRPIPIKRIQRSACTIYVERPWGCTL